MVTHRRNGAIEVTALILGTLQDPDVPRTAPSIRSHTWAIIVGVACTIGGLSGCAPGSDSGDLLSKEGTHCWEPTERVFSTGEWSGSALSLDVHSLGPVLIDPPSAVYVVDARNLVLTRLTWDESSSEGTWSTGGLGDGPEEFRSIDALYLTSDGRIAVADRRSRRITWYRSDGRLDAFESIEWLGSFGDPVVLDAREEEFLVAELLPDPVEPPASGRWVERRRVHVVDRKTGRAESLAEVPFREIARVQEVNEGRLDYFYLPPVLPRRTFGAFAPTGVVLVNGFDGVTTIHRGPNRRPDTVAVIPPRPTTRSLITAGTEEIVKNAALPPSAERSMRALLSQVPSPPTTAAVVDVVRDDGGHLWLRLPPWPEGAVKARWVSLEGGIAPIVAPPHERIVAIALPVVVSERIDTMGRVSVHAWEYSRKRCSTPP